MHHDDLRSLNLFSRLSNYVPSKGEKRERHPLEDFSTEALAYCLIRSAVFRKSFITELLKMPKLADSPLSIHTQAADNEGRPDLVLESKLPQSDKLKIEVKLWAEIRDSQLGYANFILAPQIYLSRPPKELPPSIKQLSWENVQRLLLDSVNREDADQEGIINQFVMTQFALFLAEQGFKHITMKTNVNTINGVISFASLLNEWTQLLNTLRTALDLQKRGDSWPKWDAPNANNPSSFYGIFGGRDDCRYAGFEIQPDGNIFCYYQEPFSGEKPNDNGGFDEIEPGEPGEVWITKKMNYPQGTGDKSQVIQNFFMTARKDMITFASKNKLEATK